MFKAVLNIKIKFSFINDKTCDWDDRTWSLKGIIAVPKLKSLPNDSKTVDYMSLILDYHKISSLQKGMEGFTNSLSDKIFSEIGSKQLLLLHGLSRKFILYNQIDYIIEKLNESINKDFELTKLRLVSRK